MLFCKPLLNRIISVLCLLVLFSLPLISEAAELIYTVQLQSYARESDSFRYYETMLEKLEEHERDYLRIEKIGKFYAIRVGNFDTQSEAQNFINSVKSRISPAAIMKAYIKNERIIQLYSGTKSIDREIVPAETIKEPVKEKIVPKKAERVIDEAAASRHQAKGDKFWEVDRHFLAVEEYRQAIKYGRTNNPELYWQLSKILYITGYPEESIEEMKKAVKLKPDLDVFRIELGILYLAAKQWQKSKEQFVEALGINPSLTQVYIYLGDLYFRTGDYERAWFYAKMARYLGHSGTSIINKLTTVSREPDVKPWDGSGDGLYIRQILVDSEKKAKEILGRMSEGELFEFIAGAESSGPNALKGGFIGNIAPSELHPKIVSALSKKEIFSPPVIVETESGFHIIQRISPYDAVILKNYLARAASSRKK